jgi:pentatricopeptide repeat protein
MIASGVNPNIQTYQYLIRSCVNTGQNDKIPIVTQMMESQNLKPDAHIYTLLVNYYVKRNMLQEAAVLLEEMGKQKLSLLW